MFDKIWNVFIQSGLVSDKMSSPRELPSVMRVVSSVLAVAFSYFFLHSAYFGSPSAHTFKGVYLLGTILLVFIHYKGRNKTFKDGFVWLDEIFLLSSTSVTVSLLFLLTYTWLWNPHPVWKEFASSRMVVLFMLGLIPGAALYFRESFREVKNRNFPISDVIFFFTSILVMVWWHQNYEALQLRFGGPASTHLVIFAFLFAALSFEVARRVVGPAIPLIALFFLLYTYRPIAQIFPSLLYHNGFELGRIAEFVFLGTDGMTGLVVEVFATYVVIFMILGAFLEKTGVGAIFIEATYRMTGHRTGGPGLTAVAASGLFGMISGSGVANVVTTGTLTIPLMKRVGYRAEFAAAVEAAASTGGAYMPPIMGAGAFLLAQFTETSYFEVIKIAAIPAILYYFSVGYIVYLRAARCGLHGVPTSELTPWSEIYPRLYLMAPIPTMVYFLIAGDSPFLAALKTIVMIVLLKSINLLVAIRTRESFNQMMYIVFSGMLLGLFSYFYGVQVGPPFTWFVDPYWGMNAGDALLWGLAFIIILQIFGVFSSGFRSSGSFPQPDSGQQRKETHANVIEQGRNSSVELVKTCWIAMEAGARNSLVTGCLAGILGILLSCANQSDLPGRVAGLLVELSFGLLPVTIFWIIVAGYVVGMGLPITASYVIVLLFGVLPLSNLGVPTLTAHLICYWVAVVSAVTPPVALAAYAASAIAQSDPVRTGFQALKLASWIFLMPFLFAYTPILLNGGWADVILTVIACLLGIVAWGGVLERYLMKTTTKIEWIMVCAASLALLLPMDHLVVFFTPLRGEFHYITYFLGASLLGIAFLKQRARSTA